MIRSLLLSLLLLIGCGSFAQTVGYSYKPLDSEGCKIKFSIVQQESSYYLVTMVKSEKLRFLKEPTMLLKTIDGQVIKLSGQLIGTSSESTGFLFSNIVLPSTENTSIAQFSINEKQLEQLNKGISKIRLSTIPVEHEKTFKKDKIGKKLYKLYLKQKDKDNSF